MILSGARINKENAVPRKSHQSLFLFCEFSAHENKVTVAGTTRALFPQYPHYTVNYEKADFLFVFSFSGSNANWLNRAHQTLYTGME